MKYMGSHANRGRAFEDIINLVHSDYQRRGIACIHKVPTEFLPLRNANGKINNCKVEHKSCVDYLGRYKEVPVAIEAKHTEGKRIDFSRVEPHQAQYLNDWDSNSKAMALVLVSFGMQDFYAIPWVFWRAGMENWQKSKGKNPVTINSYGWTWTTPGMASVSKEQLHLDWQVEWPRGRGMPYLDIIDKILRWEAK